MKNLQAKEQIQTDSLKLHWRKFLRQENKLHIWFQVKEFLKFPWEFWVIFWIMRHMMYLALIQGLRNKKGGIGSYFSRKLYYERWFLFWSMNVLWILRSFKESLWKHQGIFMKDSLSGYALFCSGNLGPIKYRFFNRSFLFLDLWCIKNTLKKSG